MADIVNKGPFHRPPHPHTEVGSIRRRSKSVTGALDAAGGMDAENAPTALSSGDDFKNGQKTPCLRTARTHAILTAPAAGWFSNVR